MDWIKTDYNWLAGSYPKLNDTKAMAVPVHKDNRLEMNLFSIGIVNMGRDQRVVALQ